LSAAEKYGRATAYYITAERMQSRHYEPRKKAYRTMLDKAMHAVDPFGHTHCWPRTTAVVVRQRRRRECVVGIALRSLGIAAEFHLLENLRGISKAHRRHHGLAGALPASELAIDEHTALMNGCRRAVLEGNLLGPWKQLFQKLSIDHNNSPDYLGRLPRSA
jgi:hypothetical protein